MKRRSSIPIPVGSIVIGGDHPIAIQSMCTVPISNTSACIAQIHQLNQCGADLVRVALPDRESLEFLPEVLERTDPIPLIADVHYDYKIAIEAIHQGIPKIRLNPGNIKNAERIRDIAFEAKRMGVSIRVGANSGSLPEDLAHLLKAEALAEAAMREVRILEEAGFDQIIVAVKASDIQQTLEATRSVASQCSYPLHIGLTEAGTLFSSLIKSSALIGSLLQEGIGDTIRYSITGDPIYEVRAAKILLGSLGLKKGPIVIACPTCGRTDAPVEEWAEQIEAFLGFCDVSITIAVMGCAVNGIGEGKEADLGIAGTKHGGVIFRKGKVVAAYPKDQLWNRFFVLLQEVIRERA